MDDRANGVTDDRTTDAMTAEARRVQAAHDRIAEAIRAGAGRADSLSLAVTYLLFDLEATRRENAAMKREIARLKGEGENTA